MIIFSVKKLIKNRQNKAEYIEKESRLLRSKYDRLYEASQAYEYNSSQIMDTHSVLTQKLKLLFSTFD
jgi:hypothetical protein